MTTPTPPQPQTPEQACQTPLVELLDRVPLNARHQIQHSVTNWQNIPVGVHCRDAAALIRQQSAEIERLRGALNIAGNVVCEAAQDYNHPRFTDRRGAGPRMTAAYAQIQEALAPQPTKEGGREK